MTLGEGELDFSYMTSLKDLYLEVVDLIDGELDLSKMTSLDVLDLYDMTLGEEGLNLSGMTSLRRLDLSHVNLGDGGLDLSGATSLRELRLSKVILGDGGLDLSDMASLRELRFESIDLGDRGLDLSANMVHIEKVWLKSVNMSAEQWEQFLLSVLVIQHEFNLEVDGTSIDEEFKKRIVSSPHFNVTRDGVDKYASMLTDIQYKSKFGEIFHNRLFFKYAKIPQKFQEK